MSGRESRRRRQLDELRALCRGQALARAIDLAFEHFTCFGRDADIVVLIEESLDAGADDAVRRSFAELRDWKI